MHLNPNRRQILAFTGAAMVSANAAWAEVPAARRGVASTRTIKGHAFATQWRITLPDRADTEGLRAPISTLLDAVDRQMSPWREDSEITAFNRAQRDWPVSSETALVAKAALTVAEETGGWFDPTVGPLVARWGFGPITGASIPRWRGLSVMGESLSKDDAGLTMDLCGIAKGRALDRMAAHLLDTGHEDFLIDLGGELVGHGSHPSGRDWQVAVEDPRRLTSGAVAGLRIASDSAVATSGLRVQSYTLGSQRYGHIIDPRHGAPVEGSILSVTVLAETAMRADAWATALTAAGGDGPALARRKGIAALFLFRDGERLRAQTTGDLQRHLI